MSEMRCPVENVKDGEATPQQVEVTGVKIAKKSKKIIAIVAVVLLIVALIEVAVVQGQKKKEAEEAAIYIPILLSVSR